MQTDNMARIYDLQEWREARQHENGNEVARLAAMESHPCQVSGETATSAGHLFLVNLDRS